ncbi:MAG: hypothetical protein Q7T71_12605, partial [Herbiconiux sp.]|nr:hypothetical protein [Herbiconiux sp.]
MTSPVPLLPGSVLPIALDDGLRLELRTLETVPQMHELTLRNLERLREWEQWAQPPQTLESAHA